MEIPQGTSNEQKTLLCMCLGKLGILETPKDMYTETINI